MKRICAWCGKSLNETEPPDTSNVTHGLCEQCRKSVFAPKTGEGYDDATTNEQANGLNVLAEPESPG